MSEKVEKNEETGFTIIDKRIGAKKSEETPKGSKKDKVKSEADFMQKEKESKQKISAEAPLPEVDFSSFIISLSTSVYIHLGEIPDPFTNEKNVNLAMAKQTIDIIAMLKEKSKGNRTQEEDKLINEILYNLRLNFVAVSSKNS